MGAGAEGWQGGAGWESALAELSRAVPLPLLGHLMALASRVSLGPALGSQEGTVAALAS